MTQKYLPPSPTATPRGILHKIPAAWIAFFLLGWISFGCTAIAYVLILEYHHAVTQSK